MAYTESATIVSFVAGSTFAETDLYKGLVHDGSGVVVPNTTGNILAIGTLYGRTSTTSTDTEPVPVAISGVVKLQMAGSTLAAGDFVSVSTDGFGIAPSTDGYVFGRIVSGSSGSTGRVHSVLIQTGPLNTP